MYLIRKNIFINFQKDLVGFLKIGVCILSTDSENHVLGREKNAFKVFDTVYFVRRFLLIIASKILFRFLY